MIDLAFGPDNLLHSVISTASSAPNSSLSSPLFSPVSNPISIYRPNPRPSSLTSSSWPSIWSVSASDFSSPLSFSQNGLHRDSFADKYPFHEHGLSFLNCPVGLPSKNAEFLDQSFEMATSPGYRSNSLLYPYWDNGSGFDNEGCFHRRRDAGFETEGSSSGLGYKPSLSFFKGHFHGGCGFVDLGGNSSIAVDSPCNVDAFDQCQQELTRLKAAQYMDGVNVPYNKLNFLQNQSCIDHGGGISQVEQMAGEKK